MGRVVEFSATGIDDSLQGLTSSPYPVRGNPSSIGLRVPPVSLAPSRFLFCLATCTLPDGGVIRGMRQGLKIGLDTANTSYSSPTNPVRAVESWVLTPDFRFSDGNVSWHLVREPLQSPVTSQPATDIQNFIYTRSNGPALLYKTFTNASTPPAFYYLGLTAYTPPDLTGQWDDVGGLSCFYDLRFPWNNSRAIDSLGISVASGRYSLYASILQTNPSTRVNATYQTATVSGVGNTNLSLGAATPEENFLANWVPPAESVIGAGVVYWRVMGSLIVEPNA